MSEGKVAIEVPEEGAQALLELLEVAVELRRSGVLGILREYAVGGEKTLSLALQDKGLFRLLALIQALLGGASRLAPSEYAQARMHAEEAIECVFSGLRDADPAEAPRVGLLGLMRALSDPRVQRGLGFLISLAQGVGGCLEAKASGKH